MAVGNVEFLFRAHHAAAFDAADGADRQRHVDAGHIGAGGDKGADEALAGIRRAADDLHRFAAAGIDFENPKTIGLRMLFGGDNAGDDERLVQRLVIDILDFEADGRQPLADLGE